MKALVTGGAGFIGSNLVKRLAAEGHEVSVLDNLLTGRRRNLAGQKITLHIGDVRDISIVEMAAAGVEVIFHLASSVGNARSIDHPRVDAEVNVLGTLNVLESARATGVRKVVFSSSAGIFGELKTLPIREDHPVEPDSPYGASKLCAEKLCLAYTKLHGLETVCLRYFNVYGIHQRYDAYGNVIPIFAHRLINGEGITIYGDGEQTRDFINVEDVVSANVLAGMSRGVSGAFNLGSGTSITINKLVALLRDVSGLDAKVVYGRKRKGDVRDSRADLSAIRNALSFEPKIGLEAGLDDYMRWAKVALLSRPEI